MAGNASDDELAIDVSNDAGATWLPLVRVVSSQPAWTRTVVENRPSPPPSIP